MSGLVAVFDRDEAGIARADFRATLTRIDHRGPDGSGEWYDDRVAVGHQRLASTLESQFDDQPHRDDGLVVAGVYQTGVPVVTFLVGAVIGLLSVAHAVRAAFERNREVTMAFLVSLIVGALRAPVEQASVELTQMELSWTAYWIRSFILFAIVGIAVVVAIEWGSTRVTQFEPVNEPQTES